MIGILSGTNRPGSNTRKITRDIEQIYRGLQVPYRVIDLAELPAEIFSASSYAEKPASFRPFNDAILASDGLVIVSPEYNGGMPGVLKYFIDMLKFPESFESRPVCFVGVAAGIWGALRPIEQLQLIFGYRNAFLYPDRVFIPRVNDVTGAPEGPLAKEIKGRLEAQAEGFVGFVERLREKKLRGTA